MPRNGHLNGSHAGGQKRVFLDSENGISRFPDFGLCKGQADSHLQLLHHKLA